jgi:predicted HAD superfamily Cof-like phosphohydrolase
MDLTDVAEPSRTSDKELPAPACTPAPGLFLEQALPLEVDAPSTGWKSSRRADPYPGRAAQQVYSFHRAFDLPRRARPVSPSLGEVEDSLLRLREGLLEEETTEYVVASHRRDLVGMADALADIVYVAYGTAISFGLDLDLLLDEVHRSNMSKLDERGLPVLRDDGKVLKSRRYERPQIEATMRRQQALPFAEDF